MLVVTTLAFGVCFAAWMMFGVTGIAIRGQLGLNASEFGLLTAMPVLSGAVLRLPLGIWTDRHGGRLMMVLVLVGAAFPLWASAYATQYWQFLLLGLALGLVGASFAVGTPYVARFFPRERRGFVMGVFGAGVAGAALNMFVAPGLVTAFGWQSVPKTYGVALLVMAGVFWLFSAPDPGAAAAPVPLGRQLSLLRDPRIWKYGQYYSIVFGGFTALAIWTPQYAVNTYRLSIASAALLAACFALPGGVLRAVGGFLADRFGAQTVTWWVLWAAWICLFLLSYPQTDLLVQTLRGPVVFHIGLPIWGFTVLLFILGVAFACGMASTFKYLSDDFPDRLGVASGIVGLLGGLGGFLLPVLFGVVLDITGVPSSCFMLLYGIVWVSLILAYSTEMRRFPILGRAGGSTGGAAGEQPMQPARIRSPGG